MRTDVIRISMGNAQHLESAAAANAKLPTGIKGRPLVRKLSDVM